MKILTSILLVLFLLCSCVAVAQDEQVKKKLYEARIVFNQGEYDQAMSLYKQLESDPYFKKAALLNQAIISKIQTKYSESILALIKLSEIDQNKIIYMNLGEVYYLASDIDQAIKAFNEALRLGQGGGMVHFWMGKCFLSKDSLDIAIRSFQAAVKIDDSLALAHLELGRLYFKKKMLIKAQKHLEKTKELDPSITEVYPFLAEVFLKQNNHELALKAFRKAAAVNPKDLRVKQAIKDIMKKLDKNFKKQIAAKVKQRFSSTLAKKVQKKKKDKSSLVRVLIGDTKKVRFKCSHDFLLKNIQKDILFAGIQDTLYSLKIDNEQIILIEGKKEIKAFDDVVTIFPQDINGTILLFGIEIGTGKYWASKTDRSYRRSLEININKDLMQLINIVTLEEYLYGVVPSEMPSNWPKEALRAQAVAARSEAFVKRNRHKNDGYDFCSGVHCQAYGGAKVETKATNTAVDQTYGQIAVYDNKPIDAIYCNSCGGHTQSNIFANCDPIAYLEGRIDQAESMGFFFPLSAFELEDWLWGKNIPAYCNNSKFSRGSNFRWMRAYSRKQLENIISEKLDIGTLKNIKIGLRSKSSHIKSLEIIGSKGTFEVKKELNIRRMLGNLRSSMFNIDIKFDKKGQAEEFLFYGGGWGHAVGMCQVGAATMAENGVSYKDILKFYYKDITIEKIY